MNERRTAVLVDGDNISARHSARVLSEAGKVGRIDVARVYAAANCQSEWLTASGYRFVHAGAGKNAADLLLSIDAMELALVGGVETFVIAASDRDYTHLAQRLRERGLHVLGLGEQKAPEHFRLSCTEFILLTSGEGDPFPAEATNGISEFDLKIRSMIARHSKNERGMLIQELSQKMHSAHGTRISTYPDRSWPGYLSARPALYEIDARGPEAMVRFRPEGFGSR